MVTTVHRGENQFWWQLTTSPLLADFTVTVTWFFFVALLRGQTGSWSWTCCVVWCVMCSVLNMIMFQIRHTEASPGSSSGVCVWSLSSVHAPPWHWRTLNAHLGPEFLTSWLFCGPELESVISEKLQQIYQKVLAPNLFAKPGITIVPIFNFCLTWYCKFNFTIQI